MPLLRHGKVLVTMSFESRGHAGHFLRLSDVPALFNISIQPLRLLLLADDCHPANVVIEHIQSICELSCHKVTVVNTRNEHSPSILKDQKYDVILIHYSIFLIADTYFSSKWQVYVANSAGVVAVIHEDEYQNINAFKQRFADLGVQAVFSCLDSPATLEKVYGGALLKNTLFFSCLPGYITANLKVRKAPRLAERPFDIVYRGRTLPPELGRLGQDKRIIGEQVLAFSDTYGLKVDISSAEQDRIYGPAWNDFLMSGRAMLGVEGGATIFDFDGSIHTAVETYKGKHPGATFEEIWSAVLAEFEGNIEFRTLTPKFFEAIAAGTVLILYPGEYNGILIRDRHYIPLERDGSNIADVIAKLRDHHYLQEMADRTYAEIIGRFDLSSQFYVQQIDRVLWGLAQLQGFFRRFRALTIGRIRVSLKLYVEYCMDRLRRF